MDEMILDGYWKINLSHIKHSIVFWSKTGTIIHKEFSEHKINQGLLYSAVIMRKIVEDERDVRSAISKVKKELPPLPILTLYVPIKRFQYTGEDEFFVNSKVFLCDYDLSNEQSDSLPLADMCNQIIHSYAWAIVYQGKCGIFGVLLASDREKKRDIILLSITDWVNVIQEVIDKSAI